MRVSGILILLFSVFVSFFIPTAHAQNNNLDAPDLDVTYIERTPRYKRYEVYYPNDIPRLKNGTENNKRWPEEGETVTYTGHIKNNGGLPADGMYEWYENNSQVKTGRFDTINPGEEITLEFETTWKGPGNIKLQVWTAGNTREITKKNNLREIYTNAAVLRFNVEESIYGVFNQVENMLGSYSFEDWANFQLDTLNKKIQESGSTQTARAEFIVRPDGKLPRGATHAPEETEWDGAWGFVSSEWCYKCDTLTDITVAATKTHPGLIHELAHQLGLSHNLDSKVDPENNLITGQILFPNDPNVLNKEKGDELGDAISRNTLFPLYTAYALNSNYGYRRGYYGDYLFDTPQINVIRINDASGNPIPNADLKIWQSNNKVIRDQPKFTGQTDGNGEFILPDQPLGDQAITTNTNHTLKDNPFGKINVNGGNGMFLIEVSAYGNTDYKTLSVADLNMEYWQGNTDLSVITLQTSLTNDFSGDNLALNKPTKTNYTPETSHLAVDGDKTSTLQNVGSWSINGTAPNGTYLIVDLTQSYYLTRVAIWPWAGNSSSWFKAFRIYVSETGRFEGEEVQVAKELNWQHSIQQSAHNAANHGGLAFVTYNFLPTKGRYVKLISDSVQNWITLQEVEVFGLREGAVASQIPDDTSFFRLLNSGGTESLDDETAPAAPLMCSESEYDEFAGCSETQCGYEKWRCKKNGDIREFPNQLGDCVSACVETGPVQPQPGTQSCDPKNWIDEKPYSCENGWACYNRWKITGGTSCDPEADYGEDGNWYICKEDSECGTPQPQNAE